MKLLDDTSFEPLASLELQDSEQPVALVTGTPLPWSPPPPFLVVLRAYSVGGNGAGCVMLASLDAWAVCLVAGTLQDDVEEYIIVGTCFVGSPDEEEPKKGRIIVLSVPSIGPLGVGAAGVCAACSRLCVYVAPARKPTLAHSV